MDSIKTDIEPDIDDLEQKKDVDGLIKALKNDDLLIRKDLQDLKESR